MGAPTSLNVVRLPEIKMADSKPEVEYISGTERDITEIPKPVFYLAIWYDLFFAISSISSWNFSDILTES
jgi:hypothetical protein